MSKPLCIVSCPIDTYSGYGARSRDFVRALIESKPEWDVKILSQRWGNTRWGYLKDHNNTELPSRIVKEINQQPEVWIQITVPNEFQPVGKVNIGVTAGIETTVCDKGWIDGCNRMDFVITSSEHSKKVFESIRFEGKDPNNPNMTIQSVSLQKPVEVLFEGVDDQVYTKVDNVKDINLNLSSIKEDFCFLVVGHWMQGDIGHDRKNIGYTVKAFLETFKNKTKAPALLLKVQQTTTSIMDRERLLHKIDKIKKTVKGIHPSIYLLHGDLTDSQINELYNHPKVKVLLSLTKGEGFGRPLLEFTTTGKPIIASGWSGHLDFLNREYNNLIGGELENVHRSASVDKILLKEGQWFKPNDMEVGRVLKDVFKNYKNYIPTSRKQRRYTLDNFTYTDMVSKLDELLTKYVPEIPTQVNLNMGSLNLPKLKKVETKTELPKLNLPKLNKK